MASSALIAGTPDRHGVPDAASPRAAGTLRATITGIALFSVFMLSRAYRGIAHDAVIYVGGAIAARDPDGIGRDIMFAHDGQSAFSLYPRLLRAAVDLLGPAAAAEAMTLAGLALFFAGAVAVASRLSAGRLVPASLLCALLVPSYYGGFNVFRFGEQYAVPRPVAEAAVLAALALLIAGRPRTSAVLIGFAAIVHPLMALPGAAVWLAVAASRETRWRLAAAAAAAGLVAAACAGLPIADRLVRIVDPAWREALDNNVYLFPTQWPGAAWAAILVQAATLLLALRATASEAARRVLLAILGVALAGTAVTVLLGDVIALLLVVQVQPWRALWLLAFAGAACFPLAAVALWRCGSTGRVALACLAIAWLAIATPVASAAAAVGALGLARMARQAPDRFGGRLVAIAWLAVAVIGGADWGSRALFVARSWLGKPDDARLLAEIGLFWIATPPAALLACLWVIRERLRIPTAWGAVAAASLAAVTLLAWDDRGPNARRLDERRADPALLRLLPAEPGEILWAKWGAVRSWTLAGRPSWIAYVQGAPMVFSRELATIWLDRMNRLAAARLGDASDRNPFVSSERPPLAPSVADLRALCAAPDGPVTLVVPRDAGITLPPGLAGTTYVEPEPEWSAQPGDSGTVWHRQDTYTVLPCATLRLSLTELRPAID